MTRRPVSLCLVIAMLLASGLGAAACVCRLLSSAHQAPCCEDPCAAEHAQRAADTEPGTDPEPGTPQKPPDCPGPLCFGCAPMPPMLDTGVAIACPPHDLTTTAIVVVSMAADVTAPGRATAAIAEDDARAGPARAGFDVPLRI